jgi:hypothetical protein
MEQMPEQRKPAESFRIAGRVLALFFALFSVISYVISLILGPVLFYSTSDGLAVAARHLHQLPIDVFALLEIPIPLGISFGALFLGMWILFVLCFVAAGLSGDRFLASIYDFVYKPIKLAKTNFLYIMPLVGSGLLYATILISQLQEAHGVQTGSLNFPPKTSPYVILLNLAFAPLNEEFAFRITSIGIPLALYLIYRYASTPKLPNFKSAIGLFFLTMFSPEMAKAKMGYRTVAADGLFRGVSPLEWILILITSFVFGAAHLLLGGGWEIGKVSTAFLAGFVFAIMYVSYGAYADILLHWFFNYYFTVLDMANTAYGGVIGSLVNTTEVASLFGGIVALIVFLLSSGWDIVTFLTRRGKPASPQEL